jgi:hypothetical protein
MSADVSVKVATYVTCLEALLSTEEGELTHRLAERLAFMLSTEPTEQRELFRLVKDAYMFGPIPNAEDNGARLD